MCLKINEYFYLFIHISCVNITVRIKSLKHSKQSINNKQNELKLLISVTVTRINNWTYLLKRWHIEFAVIKVDIQRARSATFGSYPNYFIRTLSKTARRDATLLECRELIWLLLGSWAGWCQREMYFVFANIKCVEFDVFLFVFR